MQALDSALAFIRHSCDSANYLDMLTTEVREACHVLQNGRDEAPKAFSSDDGATVVACRRHVDTQTTTTLSNTMVVSDKSQFLSAVSDYCKIDEEFRSVLSCELALPGEKQALESASVAVQASRGEIKISCGECCDAICQTEVATNCVAAQCDAAGVVATNCVSVRCDAAEVVATDCVATQTSTWEDLQLQIAHDTINATAGVRTDEIEKLASELTDKYDHRISNLLKINEKLTERLRLHKQLGGFTHDDPEVSTSSSSAKKLGKTGKK